MLEWHSIDTQFELIVAMLSHIFSPRKVAYCSIMGQCHSTALTLCTMQCQTLLTLIFRMCSWCCRKYFCLERWPIALVLLDVTTQPKHIPWCIVDNRWQSVDVESQDMLVMLSDEFLPWKATDSSILGSSLHTALAFSKMEGQQLLTLHWRFLLGYSSDAVASILSRKVVTSWIGG